MVLIKQYDFNIMANLSVPLVIKHLVIASIHNRICIIIGKEFKNSIFEKKKKFDLLRF